MTATRKRSKRSNRGDGRSGRGGSSRAAGRQRSTSSRRETDRFADRRRSVARRESARRLRAVFGLTVVTTVVLAMIGALNSGWFDVEELSVVGNTNADADEIIVASGIEIGQPLVDLDLDLAATRVAEVPWVGSAVVHRSWDGNVAIEVVERGPIAAIPAGDRFALVDDRGRQLDVVAERPEIHLPVDGVTASGVEGETVDQSVVPVLSVLRAVPAELRPMVAGIGRDDDGVRLMLTGGGVVVFGDDEELGEKFQSLQTILDRVDLTCLASIDVRVPGSPTITRGDGGEGVGGDGGATGASVPQAEDPQSEPGEC